MSRGPIKPPPPNLWDRVVGYFDPVKALDRARARTMMAATSGGGYLGGKRDRRGTRNWRPFTGSANADTMPDLEELRSRSRDLRRNAPIATGALATMRTNVVGDGIKLQASIDNEILGISDEQADQWERAAEREWKTFCRTADFTRVQHLADLQALIFTAALDSGDVFVVRRYRKDAGDVYGTKLQVVEADRVSNPARGADTDTLIGGVEHDSLGIPVACHVSDRHPGDLRRVAAKWEKVPFRDDRGMALVLHVFDRSRPDLARGVPYLAPVIEHLKQLADYADAEVRAAVISAMFTVFVKSDADQSENPIIGEIPSGAGLASNEAKLASGAIIGLSPGEDVSIADPKRPNALFDPFVQAFLRQVGVALELPFELLIKHFTASYSASRAALEMAWQTFKARRSWLARYLLQPAYEWMLEEAVATGRLSAPGFFADPVIRAAWCNANWIGPARASIDPLKEANADAADVALGVKTREQVCIERTGGEFEHKHAQLVKEETMRREDGLALDPMVEAGVMPDDDDSDDDTEDETKAEAAAEMREEMAAMERRLGAQILTMSAPSVNVHPAAITVSPPAVNVAAPNVSVSVDGVRRPMRRVVESHDEKGRIKSMVETEIEDDRNA